MVVTALPTCWRFAKPPSTRSRATRIACTSTSPAPRTARVPAAAATAAPTATSRARGGLPTGRPGARVGARARQISACARLRVPTHRLAGSAHRTEIIVDGSLCSAFAAFMYPAKAKHTLAIVPPSAARRRPPSADGPAPAARVAAILSRAAANGNGERALVGPGGWGRGRWGGAALLGAGGAGGAAGGARGAEEGHA